MTRAPSLHDAVQRLLTFAGRPMTVRELRDQAGLSHALFRQALDELEQQGGVAWKDDDLTLRRPETTE